MFDSLRAAYAFSIPHATIHLWRGNACCWWNPVFMSQEDMVTGHSIFLPSPLYQNHFPAPQQRNSNNLQKMHHKASWSVNALCISSVLSSFNYTYIKCQSLCHYESLWGFPHTLIVYHWSGACWIPYLFPVGTWSPGQPSCCEVLPKHLFPVGEQQPLTPSQPPPEPAQPPP